MRSSCRVFEWGIRSSCAVVSPSGPSRRPRLREGLTGQGQAQGHRRSHEQQNAGASEGDPMGSEGFVGPAPQPGAEHAADLVTQIRPAVKYADQPHAVYIGKDGGGQGDAAGPDDAADDSDGIEFDMGADQKQGEEAQAANEVDRGQQVAPRHSVGQPAQYDGAEDGGETDQADARGGHQRVIAVVDQHRYAMCAQQVHAVTAGEEPQHDLPERPAANRVARTQGRAGGPGSGRRGGTGRRLGRLGQGVGPLRRVFPHDPDRQGNGDERQQQAIADQRFPPTPDGNGMAQGGGGQGNAGHGSGGQKEQGGTALPREPAGNQRG